MKEENFYQRLREVSEEVAFKPDLQSPNGFLDRGEKEWSWVLCFIHCLQAAITKCERQ